MSKDAHPQIDYQAPLQTAIGRANLKELWHYPAIVETAVSNMGLGISVLPLCGGMGKYANKALN